MSSLLFLTLIALWFIGSQRNLQWWLWECRHQQYTMCWSSSNYQNGLWDFKNFCASFFALICVLIFFYLLHEFTSFVTSSHLNLQCLLQINIAMILEPQCAFASPQTTELQWDLRVQENTTMNYLLSLSRIPELRCRVNASLCLIIVWMSHNIPLEMNKIS